MVNTEIRLIIFFAAKDGEALYSQQKQDRELTVAQIMNSLLPNSDLKKVGKTTRPFGSVQSLSHVRLFATPWTAAHQASLYITNSWSLLKLMSIEWLMPSNHVTLCWLLLLFCFQSFPASGSFLMSWLFILGGQSIGASVLPMNIQGWFLLGLTGFISLQFKGLSRVFSNTTVQ